MMPATGAPVQSAQAKAGGGVLLDLGGLSPQVDRAFVAPGAFVVGDVRIEVGASVWFNCVIRGDVASITIGARSNVQDGSIVHADPGFPTVIGEDVLVGHMSVIHGCTIKDRGFVGMGAIVMNGAVIESDGMLAAGAMLTEGKIVRSGQLWAGRPAKYLRDLSEAELEGMKEGARHYQANAARFVEEAGIG